MESRFEACKFAQTPQCPSIEDPAMQKFFAQITQGNIQTPVFEVKDLEVADSICVECPSFVTQ